MAVRRVRALWSALSMSVVAAVTAPWAIHWAYSRQNRAVLAAAWSMTVPVGLLVAVALARPRRARRPTLAPGALSLAAGLLAVSAVLLCVGGFVGALVDLVLVPIGVAFLAVSWVQPVDGDMVPTVVLGLGLTPLAAWFAGRADERIGEGIASFVGVVLVLSLLLGLRRRRTRRAAGSGA